MDFYLRGARVRSFIDEAHDRDDDVYNFRQPLATIKRQDFKVKFTDAWNNTKLAKSKWQEEELRPASVTASLISS